MTPIIKTEDLTYTYSVGTPFEKTAVKNVNLSIEPGELIGIIGHTGSGKSTLIFEETVYKDIAFGPKNMELDEKEIDRRVRETAALVGLTESQLEQSPFELSGGQKRRVAIAGVMAMEPKVLILDEPTAGLDPKGRDLIFEQIKNYHKRTGSTVLLVSHSMEDVAKFASKILVMNKSELFCYEDTPEVFKKAEEIGSMGLAVPQITRVFSQLKQKGIDIRTDVYTMDFAVKTLCEYMESHGRKDVKNAE